MNIKLANELNFLREIAEITNNPYKERAYKIAIKQVISGPELRVGDKVPGVGDKIQKKISEFLTTGKISEAEELRQSPPIMARHELGQLLGVGPATAKKWVEMGISNLAQLSEQVALGRVKLNHMQELGLKYRADLRKSVPRAEVTSIGKYIINTIMWISPTAKCEIVGSYRRGAQESGDVDIIVSSEKHFDPELLPSLQRILQFDKHYIDTLSIGADTSSERFSFLFKLHETVRQIDILNIPWASYPAALLYFTGSYYHNEWLRGRAKALGFRLNQAGLYKNGAPIPVTTEHDIYEKIGVPYVPPEKR